MGFMTSSGLSVLGYPGSFCHPPQPFPTALGHKFERFFCIFKGSYTISCHPTPKSSNRKENVFVPSVRDRGGGDKGSRGSLFPSPSPSPDPHSNKNLLSPLNSPLICSLDKYIYMICVTVAMMWVFANRFCYRKEGLQSPSPCREGGE